jgi:preprotein translocase subunit SecG
VDRNGYPDENDLKIIREWDILKDGYQGLLETIRDMWWNGDSGFRLQAPLLSAMSCWRTAPMYTCGITFIIIILAFGYFASDGGDDYDMKNEFWLERDDGGDVHKSWLAIQPYLLTIQSMGDSYNAAVVIYTILGGLNEEEKSTQFNWVDAPGGGSGFGGGFFGGSGGPFISKNADPYLPYVFFGIFLVGIIMMMAAPQQKRKTKRKTKRTPHRKSNAKKKPSHRR